jgi:hypothetical protein
MSSRDGHHNGATNNGEARDPFWRLRGLTLYARRRQLLARGADDTGIDAPIGAAAKLALSQLLVAE